MTANRPDGHVPFCHAWSAVHLPKQSAFSMIFVRGAEGKATVDQLKTELTHGTDTPEHLERARIVNSEDRETVFLGYWTDAESQVRWSLRSQALNQPAVLQETAIIPSRRWETLQSTPEITPGVRSLTAVEPTDIHGYWGSARDRIPASAASCLADQSSDLRPGDLCLIRSGQVWAHCGDKERTLYLRDVEPKLAAAIDVLANDPETGCLSGRFLREQTIDGTDLESTSFVGWFRDLESLEKCSKTHSAHTAIFNSFLSMVNKLDFNFDLRLWHEVSVIPAGNVRLSGATLSPLAEAC